MALRFSKAKVAYALIAVLGLCTANASAQSSIEKFNRQLDQIRAEELVGPTNNIPFNQRVLFDYGGYFTFDYIAVDDYTNDNHILRQSQLYLYARANFDGAHEFFIRGTGGYQDFNQGDSFSGRGSEPIDADVDLGYYKFNLARAQSAYHGKNIDGNLIVEIGRDYVIWGNGLTMSQRIDGGMVTVSGGALQLDLIGGITPTRTTDFDSSRPDFDSDTKRGFYGAQLSAQVGVHRPYAYFLAQQDYNPSETLDIPPTSTTFNYDSYYLGFGSSGGLTDRLQYGVEMVFEGGQSRSNSFEVSPPFIVAVPQQDDGIAAGALDARLDYLVGDARRSRYSAEILFASGDPDRASSTTNTFGGNTPGTTDNAFNAFGLINTGLAYAPSVSNLMMGRVGASTFPWADSHVLSRLQVGTDFFVYGKMRREGPVDEPSATVGYLGVEPDFFVNWQITSDVTVSLRYGVFFPSNDAFGDDEPRQFFSVGTTFGF